MTERFWTCQRRLFVLLVLAFGLLAGNAVAQPTAASQAVSVSAAQGHWHGNPPCGMPTIVYVSLPQDIGGEALPALCEIDMPLHSWDGDDYDYCIALAHEWGHLVLGSDYFAATNPSDPAHSADPTSLMSYNADGMKAIVLGCNGFKPIVDSASHPTVSSPAVPQWRRFQGVRFRRAHKRSGISKGSA